MKLWMQIGATVLCIPSLLLNGAMGVSFPFIWLFVEDGDSSMGLAGLLVLAVASQAAMAIWCAWRKQPGRPACQMLFCLSVVAGCYAVAMSMSSGRGVPALTRNLIIMFPSAASFVGLSIALTRKPARPQRENKQSYESLLREQRERRSQRDRDGD